MVMEKYSITNLSRKCKLFSQLGITLHALEWMKLKLLTILSVDQNVELLRHL